MEISIGVNPARFVFVPQHGRITLRPDHFEWLLESSWYLAGDMVGIWRTNATMSQIAASLRLLPHAGMALILMPCLIVQNALRGSLVSSCARFGGCG